MAARANPLRRQLRDFVLVWTGITLMMAGCTFFAIYLAYGGLIETTTDSLTRNLPNTPAETSVAQVAAQTTPVSTRQLAPTNTLPPAATPTPTVPDATATEAQPPTATPTLLPVDDSSFQVGIQVQYSLDFNPDNQRGWMNDVYSNLGLRWFKQQVRWEEFEPERGQYNWAVLDLVLPVAAEFPGLRVMLSIVTAPNWAREAGADVSRHGPPANNQDYVNFVTALIARYPGMVHGIEVWNEQNIDREWTSTRGLSASNYIGLLRDTYQAVKNVDPGIIVVSGALSPTGLSDGVRAWDDFVYMDQMIAAGLLNYSDCIGVHHNGYNIGPDITWDAVPNDPTAQFRGPFDNPHHSWSFRSTLETYARKVRNAGGDQGLCITEFGWAVSAGIEGFNTPGFEFANDNTPEEQAQYFTQALDLMRDWGFVWLAFVWNLNYGPQAGWAADNDNVPYSIIGPNWQHRPAYGAIRDWQRAYMTSIGR
ncbi:MAG: beta-galactosidase [Chloroflexi bacterium]|nr:beta-galactosidase [Chloroflexota bacterium]